MLFKLYIFDINVFFINKATLKNKATIWVNILVNGLYIYF